MLQIKEMQKIRNAFRVKFEKEFGKTNLDQFGFEIDEGWFDLVWTLTKTINQYIKDNEKGGELIIDQIKEKFGRMRYYYHLKNVSDDAHRLIRGMVWFAETLSGTICERCGTKGTLGQGVFGWSLTLCPNCRKNETKRQNEITKKRN